MSLGTSPLQNLMSLGTSPLQNLMSLGTSPLQHYEGNIERDEWPSKIHKIGSISTQNMSEILPVCGGLQQDRAKHFWCDRSSKQRLVRMVAQGHL